MFTIRVDWEPLNGAAIQSVYNAEKYHVFPVVDKDGSRILDLDNGKYHICLGPKDTVYVMNDTGATVDRIPQKAAIQVS